MSEANPDGRPWRELDDVTRRRVVDSYRLAFLEEAPVNWCPGLGTVLANEEVTADGRSQVGNYPVYRRRMRQWMLRITAFADRLHRRSGRARLDRLAQDDAAQLDRPQRGRGYLVPGDRRTRQIQVFTTRPDTLFGATFLVLAPEHPLVPALTASRMAGRDAAASGGGPTCSASRPGRSPRQRGRRVRRPRRLGQ